MPSLRTPLDYLRATHGAARGSLTRYPRALASVLRARARHGIGPRLHSLFGLIDVPPDRWSDYLIDERLRVILRRINPPAARELVNDKLAFHDHCVRHGLATIPILCAIDDRAGAEGGSPALVRSEQEWNDRLSGDQDRLFVKLINGSLGTDAFPALRDNDDWVYCGQRGTASDFYTFSRARLGGRRGWIVQPFIRPHPSLDTITTPHALCTIRAVTFYVNGKARLLYAALRIPVGDSVTDNFAHGASGNVIAPVSLTTGELGPGRGSASRQWPEVVDITVHPDTHKRIDGFRIPCWDDVQALLIRAHTSFPLLHTLGWDIAVTESGPLIVETNATYDVDLIQVAHRSGVGPTLTPLLQQARGKRA